MSFTVTIAYKNKRGKEFNEDTVTDMDIARGSVQFEVYGVHHLAKSLRAIEKTQKKIADHLRNPIQVTTEDWKAHDERMKEDEAEMRRSYDEYLQERRRAQSAESDAVDGSEQDSYD